MNYSEEEVGKLIERASQLHKDSLLSSGHNLNLAEIETIAEELGIPSQFLIEAALEKRPKNRGLTASLWGAPFHVQETTVLDHEVSDELWEEVVSELRDYSGKDGNVGGSGSLRRWSHAVGEGENGFNFEELSLSLKKQNNLTTVQVKKEYKGAVAMYVAAFGITSFITLIVAHSLPDVSKISELIAAGLGGVLSLGGVRSLIATSAQRYRDELSELVARVKSIVTSSKDMASQDQKIVADWPKEVRGQRSEQPTQHTSILSESDSAGSSSLSDEAQQPSERLKS